MIALLLAGRSRSKALFFTLLPFVVLICFATVYIRAHYAIDVLGGLVAGGFFYLLWNQVYNKFAVNANAKTKHV